MDLVRIAARVALLPVVVPDGGGGDMGAARKQAEPARVNAVWYESGDFTGDDIVGGLDASIAGPVWAGWYGFGWVLVNRDPATVPDSTPVDVQSLGDYTWGELKEHEDLKEALADMAPYPSVAAFAADDQTIRWMCSYDDGMRDEIQEAFESAGFPEAAAKVQDVEF